MLMFSEMRNIYMYGIIDVGSNTVKLVIYQIKNGKLQAVLKQKYTAGLASYVDKNGNLDTDGLSVVVDCLKDIKHIVASLNLQEVFAFATASLRNIKNQRFVLEEIKRRCDMDLRVLSGEEEGLYDYYGAIQSLKIADGVLVDVGGGSTEIVECHNRKIMYAVSIPIGSLNLYNNFVKNILPTKHEIAEMRVFVKKRIMAELSKNVRDSATVCAVGGSARAFVKLAKKHFSDKIFDGYSPEYLREILDFAGNFPKKTANEILKVSPERIHTLLPGIIVIDTVAEICDCKNIVTSSYGVREGYLYSVLEQRGLLYE